MAIFYGGLAADDSGSDQRPPLVLLHGLTFDRRIWQPVVERVRARDATRRIVAFDLPGHGESPPQLPHDFDHLINVLERALEAADVEEPILIGHSMSGAIASLYGARGTVKAIVNVDQPPEIAPFVQLIRSLREQLRGPGFDDVWKMFQASFHTELLPPDVRTVVEQNSRPRQELVLSYWATLLDNPAEEVVAAVDTALASIATNKTPYALVVGQPLPPPLTAELKQKLPQLQIHEWSPTGHFPHLANPDRFAALITDAALTACG